MKHLLPAAVILSPATATLAASLILITIRDWWRNPFFTQDFQWAWAWWLYGPAFPMMDKWGKLYVGGSGLFGVCIAVLTVRLAIAQKKTNLYGSAKWQTLWGAWRSGLTVSLRPPGDGILLGTWGRFLRLYVSLRGDLHTFLRAPTGAGKGVSFVVPNVLNWDGPVFCFSVKRDVVNACAAERERKGDRVFVFDITEPNGFTHRWSGFGEARRFTPDIYDDIARVMWTVIPETKANNPYWDNAARKIATAVMVMLAETPGEEVHIPRLLQIVGAPDYDQQIRDMINCARMECRPYPQSAVDPVLSWLDSKAEEGAAAVRDNILTALALWNVPRVAAATRASDFALGDIRSRHVSVFVCAQPGDIRRLRAIYGLLFTQLVQKNTRVEFGMEKANPHRETRTLVMLDERWALGEMKELDDAFAFVRSYGMRFCLVLQTKSQLNSQLGEEGAKNLFSNAYVELIYGGCEEDTANEISKRIGTYTTKQESTTKPRFFGWMTPNKQSENTSDKGRALILPQEISGLPPEKVMVLIKGKPPLLLDRIFWYKDLNFRYMNGEPPPMRALEVTVSRDKGKVEMALTE